ncbi:MAG: hypothetical protein AAGA32_18645 [Pseudomonadota bacterium]
MILAAYRTPAAFAARQAAAGISEGRLLLWALIAGVAGFLAGVPSALDTASELQIEDAVAGVLAGRLFGAVFMLPLLLYVLAGLVTLLWRLLVQPVPSQRVRVALFGALLLAAPALVALSWIGSRLPAAADVFLGAVTFMFFLWLAVARLRGVTRPLVG